MATLCLLFGRLICADALDLQYIYEAMVVTKTDTLNLRINLYTSCPEASIRVIRYVFA